MFGYSGCARNDLLKLFSALKKSAREDELAPDPINNQHRNGWGMVLFSESDFFYHRSTDPIFQETEEVIPYFSGTAYAIFHAREAKTLIGNTTFSHPFHAENEDGTTFLAHNGVLQHNDLASKLDPPVQSKEKIVDSELGLKYILQNRKNGLEAATKSLEGFTKPNRALNLLILEAPRNGKPELFVKHFYKRDSNDKQDRTKYYQIYYQRLSDGVAAFSSTLTRKESEFERAQMLISDDLTPFSKLL